METVTKHVPMILLVGFICRTVIVGAQISDAVIILALSGLVYMLDNLNYNKRSIQIQQDLSKLQQAFEGHQAEIAEAKAYVSSVKMANSLGTRK